MADINGVIQQLQKNQEKNTKQLDSLNDGMNTMNRQLMSMIKGLMKSMESLAFDNLEASREQKKTVNRQKSQPSNNFDMKGLMGWKGILAGLGAVTAAFAGLRGWETKAIANIKSIGASIKAAFLWPLNKLTKFLIPEGFEKWDDWFRQKFINLRVKLLRAIGFDVTLAKLGDSKSGLKFSLLEQITDGLKSLRSAMLQSIYAMLGLGVDGKKVTIATSKGFKAKELSLAQKAGGAMLKVLGPIQDFVSGVTKFITGTGASMFKFIKEWITPVVGKAGGAVGGVAKLLGKILWPLGIFISLFDGIKAFKETEGSLLEKTVAGIYGFLGDFIGAPLDLIKGAFIWILKKCGLGVDADGNIDPSTYMGAAMQWMSDFSFEDTIKAIPRMIFKIFDGIMAFINDPLGVASDIFTKVKDMIVDSFMWLVQKAIGKVAGLIPGMSSLLPEWAISPEDKALASLKDQKKVNQNQQQSLGFETDMLTARANRAKSVRDSTVDEIAKIQKIIDTGDYAGWIADSFGGIGDEKEARAKIAKLKEKQEKAEKEMDITGRGLMRTSAVMQQLNVKNAELTESIEELRQAIEDGTASSLVIQDNSTTTGGSSSSSNQIIDTSGTNDKDDQYSVLAH